MDYDAVKISDNDIIRIAKNYDCDINSLRECMNYQYNIKNRIKNTRVRNSPEYKTWYEKIYKRDNYTCQKCKLHRGTLHPHHIYNFAYYHDLRLETTNGITLCKKCHFRFHKIYSMRKNKSANL